MAARRMAMRALWILLAGLLAVSGAAAAADVEVRVGSDDPVHGTAYLRYYPETVVVWAGDNVTWKADSDTPHTVTASPPGAEKFDSSPGADVPPELAQKWFGPGGFLMPSQSFNHTFERPGKYVYICKIHPGMVGTVTVTNETRDASGGLPLPGAGNASREAGPRWVHVAAGWGSGDTTVDRFAPDDITVPLGGTVVWTNMHSAEPHTVTGWLAGDAPPPGSSPTSQPLFDSSPNVGPPPPGFDGPQGVLAKAGANKQFTHPFASAGHYTYVCKLHPGMWGTVVVLEKPTPPPAGESGPRSTTDTGSRVPFPGLALGLAALGLGALLARRRGPA